MFAFYVGYECESMNACACLWWVGLGGWWRGPTHVLIIGPRKCGAICSSAGSGASPPASVTVIKTSRPAVVRLH